MAAARKDLITFIIEPNKRLIKPYSYLPDSYNVIRLQTIELALWELGGTKPDLVFLSASFSALKTVKFLEAFKNFCQSELMPLIMVIDFSHRLNFVPGTSWGNKIAVLDSLASPKELFSTLSRVLRS